MVAQLLPLAPTPSELPWTVENLRFCNWCDQLARRTSTTARTAAGAWSRSAPEVSPRGHAVQPVRARSRSLPRAGAAARGSAWAWRPAAAARLDHRHRRRPAVHGAHASRSRPAPRRPRPRRAPRRRPAPATTTSGGTSSVERRHDPVERLDRASAGTRPSGGCAPPPGRPPVGGGTASRAARAAAAPAAAGRAAAARAAAADTGASTNGGSGLDLGVLPAEPRRLLSRPAPVEVRRRRAFKLSGAGAWIGFADVRLGVRLVDDLGRAVLHPRPGVVAHVAARSRPTVTCAVWSPAACVQLARPALPVGELGGGEVVGQHRRPRGHGEPDHVARLDRQRVSGLKLGGSDSGSWSTWPRNGMQVDQARSGQPRCTCSWGPA